MDYQDSKQNAATHNLTSKKSQFLETEASLSRSSPVPIEPNIDNGDDLPTYCSLTISSKSPKDVEISTMPSIIDLLEQCKERSMSLAHGPKIPPKLPKVSQNCTVKSSNEKIEGNTCNIL